MATVTGRLPVPRPPGDARPPESVAGRFLVRRLIRSRGGSMTLEAVDSVDGGSAVVKVAPAGSLSRAVRTRLRHEGALLSRIDEPGLVRLLGYGESDGLLYVAAPLLPGRTLRDRLADAALPPTETLRLAEQLLAALAAIHGSGILHRHISPGSVILGDDGQATLIDFWLSGTDVVDGTVQQQPAGTATYVSPEQAGLMHHEVDERSDLYSLGVVLYECLTGAPPFTGTTVGELLRRHLSSPPPELRSAGGALPAALAQVVQRLLRKDPRDRYQTAAGALADIRELRTRLESGDPDPHITLGVQDFRRTLTEPVFVGRREELRSLMSATTAAQDGRGGVLLLEADSGGGKSRLIEEWLLRCRESGALVLRGQGVDQTARLPFDLLTGAAGDLVAEGFREETTRAALRAALAEDARTLTRVLPVLRPLLGDGTPTDDEDLGPEEFGEARTVAALARLLDSLGSPRRPAVVVLDDCQWVDDATVKLLARWQRQVAGREVHVVLVAAFRSEEVRHDHPLRSVSERSIVLPPLDDDDVDALVESMAGPVPDAARSAVRTLGAGSPFMADAVLRGLAETGAMFHDGRRWRVDELLLDQAQSSREAAAFLTRRLELLDRDVLTLLSAGAVLGKRFEVDLAATLASVDAERAVSMLQRIDARHLVWLSADTATASFVHDKLREALLDRLPPAERRDLHRAVARLLESEDAGSTYDLAFHWHAAGDDEAALPYALAAASIARDRHSLQAAEEQYRIARFGIPPADRDTSRLVESGLGDVLMLQGRYDEAEQCFERALAAASDRQDRAALGLRRGELAFKRGAVVASVGHLEDALASLGRKVPRRRLTLAAWTSWEVLVQLAHCVLPRRLYQRRSMAGSAGPLLAARIYSRLAYSYWFSRGRTITGWTHLREMNLLERYPPTLELAQAYSEHAPVMSTLPWYSRGIRYAQRSLEIRRTVGDVWGQGQSLHFYGVVLYSASRFEEAVDKLSEAIRLLERTGDQWEINTALWHIGFAHYRLGAQAEAVDFLRRCHSSAVEIGDRQATAIALSGLSKATSGDVSPEAVAAALADVTGDLHTTGELLTGEAVRLLAGGDATAAEALLRRAHREVVRAGVRNEYVAPILAWRTTALRSMAEATGPYDVGRRRRLLRQARRAAWRAWLTALAYRNNLPHVLRERALVTALAGHSRRSRRLLQRAERAARRTGMAAELATIAGILDRPTTSLGSPLPAPAPAPAAATLSLADRFDSLLRVGRRIATALTADSIFAAVRQAADELLRGEECGLVLVKAAPGMPDRLGPLDPPTGGGIREDLVRQATATGEVVAWSDESAGSSGSRSADTRSALVAPIFVRGQVIACWHVAHGQVGGLFGADEIRLAEFISAIAGAALENAEGFAEINALSKTLERRVAERTAELERANQELRRLDELKSEFVAVASHELRSPLTSILGYCTTALRHWDAFDDDRKQSFMTIIERQSKRLAALVEDLLQMSRIESGKLETSLSPIHLRGLLEGLVEDFSSRTSGVELTGDLDAAVLGHEDHLRRVLINLVDNAVKYGAPPVVVQVERRDAGTVQISVRDHGPGVPEEFVPRLFERFAQASGGTTRRATGTGLGMSIVRGLADAMNGTVEYQPAAGGGSRFTLTLPAPGASAPDAP